MSCYHPVFAVDSSPDLDDWTQPKSLSFRLPSDPESWVKLKRQGRLLKLPCRHCVGCRLDKSREWANRIVMEQSYHSESWFLTLTYDDEHLPPAFPVDPSSGEILSCHATLVKADLQDFFKRLRKNSGQCIRYYAAGEYGSSTFRPHYHVLVFGLHLADLKPLKQNFQNDQYYTSDFISKCWTFGYHILGRVTWQSAAYVARYTMKKATHGFDKRYYDAAAIEPEFQTMSLRPGIGYQYLVDHPEIFEFDSFSVSTPYGGRKMQLPEYFKKVYKELYPKQCFERSKSVRHNAEIKEHLRLLLTDKDFYDILKDDERRVLSRLSALTRDDI